ncbi:MAG: hypothetical protein OIF36_03180 [Alphaproteobacteria bacterium]|nr:hypothetical protein [Alphaproteobacteria bacterium]
MITEQKKHSKQVEEAQFSSDIAPESSDKSSVASNVASSSSDEAKVSASLENKQTVDIAANTEQVSKTRIEEKIEEKTAKKIELNDAERSKAEEINNKLPKRAIPIGIASHKELNREINKQNLTKEQLKKLGMEV